MRDDDATTLAPVWRSVLTSRRTGLVLGMVLFLFALSSLFASLVRARTALITADPYSYLLFAQALADGHLHMSGTLAEAIAHFAENDTLMQGPIWNTNILPDGRTLFTIALGYPLFLSAALKIGGTWLYTTVNVTLLLMVVLALVWCVWEGWDRTLQGFLIGATAGILFIHTQPTTFLQFSNPWREPLFYLCLTGGMGGLIRFLRGGGIGNLALAGILLGYACAVKEANAIYVAWLGLYFLLSRTWRRHPRRFRALAVFVICGVIGIAPLLIQNLVATGNPLLSMQFMRATSHYGVQGAAPGLNRHNVGNTISRYLLMYGALPWFHPGVLLVGLIGIVASWRRPAMRLFAGVFAVHLALYLQWGNADFRHSFFAHIPYSLFVATGAVWLIDLLLRRVRAAGGYRQWAGLLPLFALAAFPPPWPAGGREGRATRPPFRYADAATFVQALEEHTGPDSVLLANRVLRDVIGVYGDTPVIRLHDLVVFNPDGSFAPVIDWIRAQGHSVYFLDNPDLDPRNLGRIRWDKVDRSWLLEQYDLVPAAELDCETFRIGLMTGGNPLAIFRVEPWTAGPHHRELVVPDDGAAFLFLHPRAATGLRYRLDGVPFVPDPAAGYYQPLPPLTSGSTVLFEWEGGEGPVPGLRDLHFVARGDVIRQECGADALPDDRPVFPDGGLQPEEEGVRRFFAPITIRMPVCQSADQFTTVGLGINRFDGVSNLNLYVSTAYQPRTPLDVVGSAAWFPLLLSDTEGPVARVEEFTLSTDEEVQLKMNRIKSIPAYRAVRRRLAPDEAGAALMGRLVPDVPGGGPHPWSAVTSAGEHLSGRCLDDPRRSFNAFQVVVSNPGGGGEWAVALQGGGLMNVEWAPVADQLHILPGTPQMAFISDGAYGAEQVAGERYFWTGGSVRIQVPVTPGAGGYDLTLLAADGHPGDPRVLHLQFEGQTLQVELSQMSAEFTLHVDPTAVERPTLRELTLDIPTWSPRDTLGFEDDRTLGFMVYSIDWRPRK